MKGVVFVHFLEMVENRFGYDMADEIIEASTLATRGAYTAVGTYDHTELLQLVTCLSRKTRVPVHQLMEAFGKKMFAVLSSGYPEFIKDMDNLFSLLQKVEDIIHVEVKKLYPDAELPSFRHRLIDENTLELIYASPRPFADFAKGLILGCVEHFREDAQIRTMEPLAAAPHQKVRFVIVKEGGRDR